MRWGRGGDRYHPASPAMTVQRTRLFVTMRSIQGRILISIICKRLLLTDIGDLSWVWITLRTLFLGSGSIWSGPRWMRKVREEAWQWPCIVVNNSSRDSSPMKDWRCWGEWRRSVQDSPLTNIMDLNLSLERKSGDNYVAGAEDDHQLSDGLWTRLEVHNWCQLDYYFWV